MRQVTLAVMMVAMGSLAAWAEPGSIVVGGGKGPVTIDSERLQGDKANSYAVTVEGKAHGMLSFELRPSERTLHPHLKLADQDAGTVNEAYAEEDGKVTRLEMPIAPGRYTLEVDDSHRVTRQKPYRMIARFTPVSDRFEPNDTFETAHPLPLNQPTEITFFKAGEQDKDHFTVQHPGGTLNVDVTAAKGISPGAEIFNADRENVGAGYASNEGAALHHAEELPAGTYTIVLSDATNSNTPTPVKVTVSAK